MACVVCTIIIALTLHELFLNLETSTTTHIIGHTFKEGHIELI